MDAGICTSRLYVLWIYFNYGTEDEKQTIYIGLVRLCLSKMSTKASTSSTGPVLTQRLSDFNSKLPIAFNDTLLTILKITATDSMMQESQQTWLPYDMFKSRDIRDEFRIGGRLLHELYNTMNLNSMEDSKYFSTTKLMNVSQYALNYRMYSHNTLSRGSDFAITTDDFNNSTVAATHSSI